MSMRIPPQKTKAGSCVIAVVGRLVAGCLSVATFGILTIPAAPPAVVGPSLPAAHAATSPPPLVEVPMDVAPAMRRGPFAGTLPLRMPKGFHVSLVAVVPGVRFGVVGPDGQLVVSQMGAGRVLSVSRSGQTTVLASGLENPHGLAYRNGVLYVAETTRVFRVPRAGAVEIVTTDLPSGGAHFTRTIGFGPDGALYVSVGSTCDACVESDPRLAAILRFQPDGSHREIFATGLRNAVGITWDPSTHVMWADVMGRDHLGDDVPPDTLVKVIRGGFYGWPYCYGDRVPDPSLHSPERCRDMVSPALQLQAHSAPLGLVFYTGTAFPEEYRGGLFVAFHGSWNRSVPTGYKLVYLPFRNGVPTGSVQDFATGWLQSDGRAWGRPVDPIVAPDGSLYLTDDRTGAIYRIWYAP